MNKASLIRLKKWCKMKYVCEYLDHKGALNKNVSKKGYDCLRQKYFIKLKERIAYCKNIKPKDEFVFYTLAQLYTRIDLDGPKENLYKLKSRYYVIKAIRKNKRYSKAWALLAKICSWVSLISGNENGKDRPAYFAEKAITCLKKALKFNPENKKYQKNLKGYYHLRNEEYKH